MRPNNHYEVNHVRVYITEFAGCSQSMNRNVEIIVLDGRGEHRRLAGGLGARDAAGVEQADAVVGFVDLFVGVAGDADRLLGVGVLTDGVGDAIRPVGRRAGAVGDDELDATEFDRRDRGEAEVGIHVAADGSHLPRQVALVGERPLGVEVAGVDHVICLADAFGERLGDRLCPRRDVRVADDCYLHTLESDGQRQETSR